MPALPVAVIPLVLALSPEEIEGPNPYGALTTWPVVLVIIGILGLVAWWAARSSGRGR